MDTKLEAPGQIEHVGDYLRWSFDHDGKHYELNAHASGWWKETFVKDINHLYKTGQILKDIPRETESFVRFNSAGELEEVKLECPATS